MPGPISEFPGRYQQSYAELFRRAQPMDFGIGYRWRTHESNLLLSVRLPDEAAGRGGDLVDRAAAADRRVPRKPRPPAPSGRSSGGFFWFGR